MFSSLIGAIIGAVISSNISYKSNAHGESGWRSKLLDLSSVEAVGMKEILKLQSFINPTKNDTNLLNDFCNINDLDDLTSYFCNAAMKDLVIPSYVSHRAILPNKSDMYFDADDFRYICKVVLKNDWIVETASIFNRYDKQKNLFITAKNHLYHKRGLNYLAMNLQDDQKVTITDNWHIWSFLIVCAISTISFYGLICGIAYLSGFNFVKAIANGLIGWSISLLWIIYWAYFFCQREHRKEFAVLIVFLGIAILTASYLHSLI